jgi:hypothetical protein
MQVTLRFAGGGLPDTHFPGENQLGARRGHTPQLGCHAAGDQVRAHLLHILDRIFLYPLELLRCGVLPVCRDNRYIQSHCAKDQYY